MKILVSWLFGKLRTEKGNARETRPASQAA